jgi:hypothetical protein
MSDTPITSQEAVEAMQPKLCINCKHLTKSISGAENWKCFAEQNIVSRETDLVTGETVVKRHFLTCYDARKSALARTDIYHATENCGPEGQWFEPAPPKFEEPSRSLLGSSKRTYGAADLLSQLDGMK